ncbi:MAG: hypothetical protein K8S98_15715 [Planctomycetes bacterium]|nr:hypothetical protein [Planctomycetota bacterium]
MILVEHLLATACVLLGGAGWLAWIDRASASSRSFFERLGLAYFVGLGWTTFAAWGLGAFGSCERIPLLVATLLPALLLLRRKRKIALPFARDVFDTGATFDYVMPRGYPKLPGLALFAFAYVRAEWSEHALNLVYFNYLAFFLAWFHGAARAFVPTRFAWLATAVVAGFPLMATHAVQIGYSDLPFLVFLSIAGFELQRWADERRRADLVLALFALSAAAATKIEGRVPCGVVGALLLASIELEHRLRVARWKLLGAWFLAGAAAVGAMIVLDLRYGDGGPPFLSLEMWRRVRPGNHWSEIGGPALDQFVTEMNTWMVLGTLLPFVVVVAAVRVRGERGFYLVAFTLLVLTSYAYVFTVGDAYRFLVRASTVNRAYLHLVPLLVLACALHLAPRRTASA